MKKPARSSQKSSNNNLLASVIGLWIIAMIATAFVLGDAAKQVAWIFLVGGAVSYFTLKNHTC